MTNQFSATEMDRRLTLTREFMKQQDLDALLLYSGSASAAGVCWLSNHRDLHGSYLVVPRDSGPTLYVSLLNHLPNAQERSAVPTEWGGHQPMDAVAKRLHLVGARRVGLVGGRASMGLGMPYRHYLDLCEQSPDVEFIDATAGFDTLLLIKSEEEIECLRKAAALTDLALAALAEHARPGITEHELIARAEYAYRREGAQVGITFLRSMPMDNPSGFVPAQRPSGRQIVTGDVIICELSAVYQGYSGQVLWPVFVGVDPTPEWQRLFDAAYDAYQSMTRAVRHGASIADAIAAAGAIQRGGYTICDSLLHGFGLSLHPPYVDPEEFENPPDDGPLFERGMAIVLQPNPITRDERMGIQLGALAVVRDDGAETLHDIPAAPLIAGR